MRLPGSDRRNRLKFQMTSLIDVSFLLIIFFLAASFFVQRESSDPVRLPSATQRDEEPDTSGRLTVTILADGTLRVAERTVDLVRVAELVRSGARDRASEFEVRLRGDRDAAFRTVEPLLVECARAGVAQVKFAVIAPP